MPASSASNALAFAPNLATLEAAIAQLAREPGGGVVAPATRRDALARFGDLPIPGGRRPGGWKYDYGALALADLSWRSARVRAESAPFVPATPSGEPADPLALANAGGLVHLGGTYLEAPQRPTLDPRIVVVPLADAFTTHAPQLERILHRIVDWRSERFAALAAAFQNAGAFVYVPDGVVLAAPVVLVFADRGSAEAEAVFPHVVVALGAGARATVIERHFGEGANFVSAVVEAEVGDEAALEYVVMQRASDEARLFATRGSRCGRGARIHWRLAELGSALSRSVVDARLGSEGSEAEIDALFFNTEDQHVDLVTTTCHEVGHTRSHTVVRSAATDRGQGRYFGNIAIREHAHGSDAALRDDALLLSEHAHIDSIPALEIAANDVKAFHGATVGSIDEEALFYAQSRGLARRDAKRMIALGFFEPALVRTGGEDLRDEIRAALDEKVARATEDEP
ncbi:MAG: Fe-S cluster assembly protein SufD [Vulcanimicrobiaceae bacterium]